MDKEKEIEEFSKQKKSTYFYINCLVNLSNHEVLTKLTKSDTNIELIDKNDTEQNDTEQNDTEQNDTEQNDNNKNSKGKSKKNKIDTKMNISSKSYLTFDKSNEEIVIKIIKAMCKGVYSISNIIEKTKKSNAPAPFTTSTLQQVASLRLGMDSKRTMNVSQTPKNQTT